MTSAWASLVAQRLKRLPAVWETWVRSLGWEDPLEKEMASHSSILAWRIPWTEELGGYSPRVAKSQTRLSDFTFTFTLGSSTQVSSVAQSWLGRSLYKGTREGIPRDGREEYGAMDPKR